MVDQSSLVQTMCEERGGLRDEIIHMENAISGGVFAFLTVVGIFGGVYWNENIIHDELTRAKLIFGLTQLEFFIGVFLMSLVGNIGVHAGYLQALEHRINRLLGERVSIWESYVGRRYIFHPRGSQFWSNLLLVLFVFGTFVSSVMHASLQMKTRIFLLVGFCEIAALLAITVGIILQTRRIRTGAESILGTPVGDRC